MAKQHLTVPLMFLFCLLHVQVEQIWILKNPQKTQQEKPIFKRQKQTNNEREIERMTEKKGEWLKKRKQRRERKQLE